MLINTGCGGQFWLNILLTLLGGIPGLIHAIYSKCICYIEDW
jgi:uncharacterized membrane protein YqaE (UPF0057 family)